MVSAFGHFKASEHQDARYQAVNRFHIVYNKIQSMLYNVFVSFSVNGTVELIMSRVEIPHGKRHHNSASLRVAVGNVKVFPTVPPCWCLSPRVAWRSWRYWDRFSQEAGEWHSARLP